MTKTFAAEACDSCKVQPYLVRNEDPLQSNNPPPIPGFGPWLVVLVPRSIGSCTGDILGTGDLSAGPWMPVQRTDLIKLIGVGINAFSLNACIDKTVSSSLNPRFGKGSHSEIAHNLLPDATGLINAHRPARVKLVQDFRCLYYAVETMATVSSSPKILKPRHAVWI